MTFQLHLETEPIGRISAHDSVCVKPGVSLRSAIETMKTHASGSVLICDGRQLLGILTERDVLTLMSKRANFERPVDLFMTSNPMTVSRTDTVGKAIQLMAGGGYRRLPIVDDDGCPIAILKVADVLHYLVEHFPHFIYNLPPTPHHATQHREGA